MSRSQHTAGKGASSSGRHPTAQAVLIDHLQQAMNRTGLSLADFAEDLADAYAEAVADAHRSVPLATDAEPEDAEAYFRWKQSLTKQVQRLVDGSVRFPLELAPAWISALPSPYSERCRHEFCAVFGVLPIETPDGDTTAEHIGEVLEAAGRESIAAGPIFADGKLTRADLPHVDAAITAHEQSAAKSLSMASRLRRFRREHSDDTGGGSPLRAVE